LYDFPKFIADAGGYLGLLLGASIPSIYDYLVGVLKRIFKWKVPTIPNDVSHNSQLRNVVIVP
jgi:hypothetical protein